MRRRAIANSPRVLFPPLSLLLIVAFGGPMAGAAEPEKVPPVMLSAGDAACCLVGVGNDMPTPSLPDADGNMREPTELAGDTGTVVVVWQVDNPMTRTLLADLKSVVQESYGETGISVSGVAVGLDSDAVRRQLTLADAKFPVLLDRDGAAFAQIGKDRMPRVYVLDAEGIIVWFDIEYSRATRRELQQTLRVLTR